MLFPILLIFLHESAKRRLVSLSFDILDRIQLLTLVNNSDKRDDLVMDPQFSGRPFFP